MFQNTLPLFTKSFVKKNTNIVALRITMSSNDVTMYVKI